MELKKKLFCSECGSEIELKDNGLGYYCSECDKLIDEDNIIEPQYNIGAIVNYKGSESFVTNVKLQEIGDNDIPIFRINYTLSAYKNGKKQNYYVSEINGEFIEI